MYDRSRHIDLIVKLGIHYGASPQRHLDSSAPNLLHLTVKCAHTVMYIHSHETNVMSHHSKGTVATVCRLCDYNSVQLPQELWKGDP